MARSFGARRPSLRWGLALPLLLCWAYASSAPILDDFGINVDGVAVLDSDPTPFPSGVDLSGFDPVTGLGSILVTVTGSGDHLVSGFFDHSLEDAFGNDFANEYGAISGAASAGQSWQIDDPFLGAIVANWSGSDPTAGSLLDNTNYVADSGSPTDVSMAMAHVFALLGGETAFVEFLLSSSAPAGFYLQQIDVDSGDTVFLTSTLRVENTSEPPPSGVPIPSPAWLLGAGLAPLLAGRVRRRSRAYAARDS